MSAPDDEALAALQGATFDGPLALPSGRKLTAEAANKATRHPIATGAGEPWEFSPGRFAFMWGVNTPNGSGLFVQLVDDDGESVLVPASSLVELAKGLLAAHVEGSRPEWQGET